MGSFWKRCAMRGKVFAKHIIKIMKATVCVCGRPMKTVDMKRERAKVRATMQG